MALLLMDSASSQRCYTNNTREKRQHRRSNVVATHEAECLIPVFFFQAEDGIRDVERSRGLGDVYKRQPYCVNHTANATALYLLHAVRTCDTCMGSKPV